MDRAGGRRRDSGHRPCGRSPRMDRSGTANVEDPRLLAESRALLPGGWTDRSAAFSFRGFGFRRHCSARTSPCGGRPSQGSLASRSAPSDVAASSVAAPSSPFPRPRGVPSIGQSRDLAVVRRLPQASPPSQGTGRNVLTGPARTGSPLLGFHAPPATWTGEIRRTRVCLARHGPSSEFLAPSTACSPSGLAGTAPPAAAPGVSTPTVLSSAKAVTRFRVRRVLPTPARVVLPLSRAGGRTCRTLENA